MTDKLREAAQMALDALEAALSNDQPYISRSEETAESLRARLAQPEPEPVAWMHPTSRDCVSTQPHSYKEAIPLYTAPPQREWQGLTENDFAIWKEPAIGILRWAEAVLKERNK